MVYLGKLSFGPEVGDVVKLSSGGPEMTVERKFIRDSLNDEEKVECTWYDNDEKQFHTLAFNRDLLSVVRAKY